jgi:hypothetical protein
MSNPGVIYLTEKILSDGTNFRVEDNLGEAIHLHYSKIRIDLSIKDFLYIADSLNDSVNKLLSDKGFKISDYDIGFLNKYACCLADLKNIEQSKIKVNSLRLQGINFLGLPITKRIRKNIKFNKIENVNKIILFNNSNIIIYGDSLAINDFLNDTNSVVLITRFIFSNNRYTVKKHPWMAYIFCWNKKRIYRLVKKIVKKVF